jgi:hypothetical protein
VDVLEQMLQSQNTVFMDAAEGPGDDADTESGYDVGDGTVRDWRVWMVDMLTRLGRDM